MAIPTSLEEQQAIAKPLVALAARIEVVEKKVAVLQDLFRTLFHELMTAKTRVNPAPNPNVRFHKASHERS